MSELKFRLESINTKIKEKIADDQLREEEAVARIKLDPKYFYSYAKKSSKVKCKVGPLKDESGHFEASPEKMANMLQEQFCSVFSNPSSADKEEPNFPPVQFFI